MYTDPATTLRTRATLFGTASIARGLAAATLALSALAATGSAGAEPPQRAAQRASASARRMTVAIDAASAGAQSAELTAALARAVDTHPALRLHTTGTASARLVLRVTLRLARVQRNVAGSLARCELSAVMSTGTGALMGEVAARGSARGDAGLTDAALAQAALRAAVERLVRDVARARGPLAG